jgi:hypothetical protein
LLDTDDVSIADATSLFRRVKADKLIYDENQKRYRASGQAFTGQRMSIYIEGLLLDLALAAPDVVAMHEGYSVASLTAAQWRHENQVVVAEPDASTPPHPCDPCHGLVIGTKANKLRARMAKASRLDLVGDTSFADASRQ